MKYSWRVFKENSLANGFAIRRTHKYLNHSGEDTQKKPFPKERPEKLKYFIIGLRSA